MRLGAGRRGRVHAPQVRAEASVKEAKATARSEGLALMLDDGTRKSHSMAENSAFVSGFFRGVSTKEQFGQLVASLYFVYKAMEEAFDSTDNPNVKALDYASLRRMASLEQDMEFYFGPDWRGAVKPTLATQKYVGRILEVARDNSNLLIAHQYTRYLGDLFGGQMMGGMATRSLGLKDGKGIAFYQFDDIPCVKDFIEEWYAELNKLELPEGEKERIVEEANNVFTLNIYILDELEGNALVVAFKLAIAALQEKLGMA